MKYRVVIFDFDGTLADTFPWFARHVDQASTKFKFRRIEPNDIPLLRKQSAREVIEYLKLPFWKIPLIARYMRRAMSLDVASIQLFAGIAAILHKLHRSGVTLAIVSSNLEGNVRAVLGAELAGLVSMYECGSSLFGKGRRFQRVLKRTGLQREEAVCIGDELRDYHAAQAVGITFGAVSWGYTDPEAFKALKADTVFESVEEMARWLEVQ